jgi:hypothetical protein
MKKLSKSSLKNKSGSAFAKSWLDSVKLSDLSMYASGDQASTKPLKASTTTSRFRIVK